VIEFAVAVSVEGELCGGALSVRELVSVEQVV
jgi:hypothetical protein